MLNFDYITTEFETLIDFLRFGVSQAQQHKLYFGHGTDNAWDEMLLLLFDSLHLPLNSNPVVLQARLTSEEKQRLLKQLKRRIIDKVPVPYITNKAYFCELDFYVDERVLIPRSPLAELIKKRFSPWIRPAKITRILDFGTGSGCLAIALSYIFPEAHIDALDHSKDALDVAEINCQRHRTEHIRLIQSDCWLDLPKAGYDLIISNPPYVGLQEFQNLPAEYRHEPQMALLTEQNGVEIITTILSQAHSYLKDEGILVVEVGNSVAAVEAAFPQLPFVWLELEHGGQGVFLLTKSQLLTLLPQDSALIPT